MNTQGRIERFPDLIHEAADIRGQRSSVCITKDDTRGSPLPGGLDGFEGIGRIRSVTIEKMLGVVDDLIRMLFEKSDRIVDQFEVLLKSGIESRADMQVPRLAEDRDDGGL